MSAEDRSDYEQKILENIEAHGCHITYVFDPDGDEPSFAYSVGFTHSLGQGEVIVFGLSNDITLFMINEIYRQCRDKGLILADGLSISGLLEGFEVVARAVRPDQIQREYFNSAMWYSRRQLGTDLILAYQLVWPSSLTGLFPWQPGCHPDVIAMQPALYHGSIH